MDENWTLMDEMHPSSCDWLLMNEFHPWMMSECKWHIVCLYWMIEILIYVLSYIGDRFQYDIHDICQKIMKFQNLEKSNEPIRQWTFGWRHDKLNTKWYVAMQNLGRFMKFGKFCMLTNSHSQIHLVMIMGLCVTSKGEGACNHNSNWKGGSQP